MKLSEEVREFATERSHHIHSHAWLDWADHIQSLEQTLADTQNELELCKIGFDAEVRHAAEMREQLADVREELEGTLTAWRAVCDARDQLKGELKNLATAHMTLKREADEYARVYPAKEFRSLKARVASLEAELRWERCPYEHFKSTCTKCGWYREALKEAGDENNNSR